MYIILFFNFHTVPIILIHSILSSCIATNYTIETIPTSCQLKMKHIIIIIIITIIIWVIFEIDLLNYTKITSRSIARTWPSTIGDNIKINTEITLIEQSYPDILIKQSDRLFLWASDYSKITPLAILLFYNYSHKIGDL